MNTRLAPPLLMAGAALLFSLMGALVKLASAHYGTGEIVFYRSLVGLVVMLGVLRARRLSWRSPVPAMHVWRSLSGTTSLCLWFYALGALPLATATTLNIMSSVWIALFLMGSAALARPGHAAVDGRLVAAVAAGFAGVALVLRPTVESRLVLEGLVGLLSGLLAATAYLQVTALGRVGEPGERVVLYFSLSGVVAGLGLSAVGGGLHGHDLRGAALLLGVGLLATGAQWLLTRAYATGATLGIAALQYLGVAFSFGLGVLVFDDPVTPTALTGMVLIVGAGVAAIFLRPNVRRTATPALPDAPPSR